MGADNGATGLIGALEFNPDLILCDVMMPELNGHEVLAALRQEPQTVLTPFIFLTALADKGDIRKGMTIGADDYITKPFTYLEVTEAIATRLQKQATLTEQQTKQKETELARIAELQQEIESFRERLDEDQANLINDVRSQIKTMVGQLNTVTITLTDLPPGKQREQSITTLKRVCADGVRLLTKIPNFDYLADGRPQSSAHTTSSTKATAEATDETLLNYTEEDLILDAF